MPSLGAMGSLVDSNPNPNPALKFSPLIDADAVTFGKNDAEVASSVDLASPCCTSLTLLELLALSTNKTLPRNLNLQRHKKQPSVHNGKSTK